MNYWKHSMLSKKKFDGSVEDYLSIHKFLDSSKLFYFDLKHRALLHHTYGIELCIQKFGDTIVNSKGQTHLVRDIAAEHCKEDLMGVVPTLNNWFKETDETLLNHIKLVNPIDQKLKEFVNLPFIMSGLRSTLLITHSNFGVYLVKEFLGIDYALEWARQIESPGVNELLQYITLKEKWQYSPDLKQLKSIDDGFTI